MDCTAQIDALAEAVDAWTATTQESQAIKAQRDMLDSAAMQAMYQAYWNLSVCQFGGGLTPQVKTPRSGSLNKASDQQRLISSAPAEAQDVPQVTTIPLADMVKFIGDVTTIQKNRA